MNWSWRSCLPITAELARLRSELAEKESQQLDAYLQALRNQLNSQRQLEAERALESTELLAENSADLPKDIVAQFKINRELSAALNQQAQRMDLVASQQRQAASQTLQVRQALNTLREQSQWLGSSNLLGEALRAQVARLPEMPKPQQLDTEMAQLRVQRLRYEDLLNKQPLLRQIHQADGQPLTAEQNRILEAQLRTQRELLNSLLQGGDTLLLELTKLKVSNGQLEDALKEVNEATHRYLFWTSDVRPMTIAGRWKSPGSASSHFAGHLQSVGQSQCDDADQQRDNFAAVWRVDSGRLQYLLAPLFHPFS